MVEDYIKKLLLTKQTILKKNARIHRNISFLNISDEKLTKEYSRMFNVGKKIL